MVTKSPTNGLVHLWHWLKCGMSRLFDRDMLFGPPQDMMRTVIAKYDSPEEAMAYNRDDNPERSEEAVSWIRQWLPTGAKVLHVGCGAGQDSVAWASIGYQVVAIDIAPAMVDEARKRAVKLGVSIELHVVGANNICFEKGIFDLVVFGSGTYSYIPSRALRLGALYRACNVLKPGGLVSIHAFTGMPSRLSATGMAFLFRRVWEKVLMTGSRTEWGDTWARRASSDSIEEKLFFLHIFPSRQHVAEELKAAGLEVWEDPSSARLMGRKVCL